MSQKIIIISFFLFFGSQGMASGSTKEGIPLKRIIKHLKNRPVEKVSLYFLNQITPQLQKENPKVVALILTGTLGVFGAHRIYLGTDPKIPIFYTITLGGGLGVLPTIDFLAILLTKDLSKYYQNDKIFMWSK